jgi:uncharacterized membrane protein YfhO
MYLLLAFGYRRGKRSAAVYASVFLVFVFAEAFVNLQVTGVNTTGRTGYLSDNAAIETLLDGIDDTDFYRVEKLRRRTKNDAAWHHYHGVSLFSSTANAGVSGFLSKMGGEKSTNSYGYYGATPLVEAMLSVRYVLSKEEVQDSALRQLEGSEGSEYLFRNIYTLPLGFWLPGDMEDVRSMGYTDPLTVQNEFARLAADVDSLFPAVDVDVDGDTMQIEVDTDKHLYVYVTTGGESFHVLYEKEGEEDRTKDFTNVNQMYLFDLGFCEAGTEVTITVAGEDLIRGFAHSIDYDRMAALYQTLSEQAMEVVSYDDEHVSGVIEAKKDGILFTSIPYEKGWKVLLDGEEAEVQAFQDAFLSIEIPAGRHTVEFSYYPYGLNVGIGITAASLLVFLAAVFVSRHRKRIYTGTSAIIACFFS